MIQAKPTRVEEMHAIGLEGPRVALLTPYNGGNLGDAAIQDSMIANLRARIPNAQFLGITLNDDNFLKRHGGEAFPFLATLTATSGPRQKQSKTSSSENSVVESIDRNNYNTAGAIRRILWSIPRLRLLVRRWKSRASIVGAEFRHSIKGYRILRKQDLLLISGGGQLDEEYGGSWRLPFAYFKWTLLSKLAGTPCALVSVGTGSIKLPASRRLISMALRMCCYRSFREARSRTKVTNFFRRACSDSVVPDLAFSLPDAELPKGNRAIRHLARGRRVVTLSPICFAKPGCWPTPNKALYERYVSEMARAFASLIEQDYFVVVACSSLGDDERVIPDMIECLGAERKPLLRSAAYFPVVKTWRDFVAVLKETDCLVASRLHGTILGFVSSTPVVAISFDPKVDWVMEDLDQTAYLMHFQDFTAAKILVTIERINTQKSDVITRISAYRRGVLAGSGASEQYDLLSRIAKQRYESHI